MYTSVTLSDSSVLLLKVSKCVCGEDGHSNTTDVLSAKRRLSTSAMSDVAAFRLSAVFVFVGKDAGSPWIWCSELLRGETFRFRGKAPFLALYWYERDLLNF